MLEHFFVVPAVAQRLRDGAFSAHLDGFCGHLVALGYRPATIRHKLRVVSSLMAWMAEASVAVVSLDESRAEEFLLFHRQPGRRCRGLRRTLRLLLEWLRVTGAVPTFPAKTDDVPSATLLARYELHLRQERALAEGTVVGYLVVARAFVTGRLDDGT